jgi:glycosyltransferase involved in cell wall biosynthesis
MKKQKKLALFTAFSGRGGVERVNHNLLRGLSEYPLQVDLLAVTGKNGVLPEIPWDNVRVIRFRTRHSQLALLELASYLKLEKPDVMLVAKYRAIRMAVVARWLSGLKVPLVGQLHNKLSNPVSGNRAWQHRLHLAPARWLLPGVDKFICVSGGVAEDISRVVGISPQRIVTIANPVIAPGDTTDALQAETHPWCRDQSVPLVLGAGRLSREKDFSTLIQAFGLLCRQRDCRLLILGEGSQRPVLEAKIQTLGLQDRIALPGYTTHLPAYLAGASLVVLSSIWEGSGNVLVEALAQGIPVVSTDCEGPREILANGRYGLLVPVGDASAMAQAMLRTLDEHLPAAMLKEAVRAYSIQESTKRYIEELGLLT